MKKIILLCVGLLAIDMQANEKTVSYHEIDVHSYYKPNPQEMLILLRSIIGSNDLVFDVGANIGSKTETYLKCGARVVCFEPQPECIKSLQKKFCTAENVMIEQVGLAEQTGNLNLHLCESANTLATFSQDWTEKGRFADRDYHWSNSITVPVSTLDHMIAKYGKPRFCKIDVENFEYNVLRGLTQPIEYLSFECHAECLDQATLCVNYLEKIGYTEFNFAPGEHGWFIFKKWLPAQEFLVELTKVMQDPFWKPMWGLFGDAYARHE